jgi:hypothetical protein
VRWTVQRRERYHWQRDPGGLHWGPGQYHGGRHWLRMRRPSGCLTNREGRPEHQRDDQRRDHRTPTRGGGHSQRMGFFEPGFRQRWILVKLAWPMRYSM